MPPANELQRLHNLKVQLERVLHLDDWDAIREIDRSLRDILLSLRKQGDEPSAELLAACRDVQHLHGLARQRCQEECQRLRVLLDSHEQPADGRSAYAWVESLR
ncbi:MULTISPECIES: hypothetical protein [Pseudomonas]|uniref:Flagellar protein FliT n=1 Tax=Serpens gallinarum TaxID=2763075 RepID=A0ABR8TMJ5_9PSED|nr:MULTISPECIES: hypothetical protein [Pseudomonas]MBD7976864.1 hypothetical protein [Serpens gallinarum]MBF0676715.1 hypothetical protein [Pseudomonas sp.]